MSSFFNGGGAGMGGLSLGPSGMSITLLLTRHSSCLLLYHRHGRFSRHCAIAKLFFPSSSLPLLPSVVHAPPPSSSSPSNVHGAICSCSRPRRPSFQSRHSAGVNNWHESIPLPTHLSSRTFAPCMRFRPLPSVPIFGWNPPNIRHRYVYNLPEDWTDEQVSACFFCDESMCFCVN
jgi:hypothetical protein